jgi:hypothetical protein
MPAFLEYFNLTLVASFATFVVGVVFSQKIKDWVSGVPAEVRAAMKGVEAAALGNVKVAQASVLAQLKTALPPLPTVTAAVTAPVVAPVAPAPAPAPATPAA